MKTIVILSCIACCMLANVAAATAGSVNPFLLMFGKEPRLTQKHVPLLAQYDLLILDRFRFEQINNNPWKAIKSASPNTKIFLYQLGPLVSNKTDAYTVFNLNNLGRFDASRGSSDGSLNKDHPDWFLKNIYGKRVNIKDYPYYYWLDFGNAQFVDYWIKHTLDDISFKKWRADGIYIDEAVACLNNKLKNMAGYTPVKYLSCESWDKNMNDYLARASAAIHKENQLVAANRGHSRFATGTEAWRQLDKINSPLDFLLEEGAFAVEWGDGDVYFFPVEEWKRQIDLPAAIERSAIGMISHTALAPNKNGFTATGKPISHAQVLRFATGSYLLARNLSGPKTYFFFVGNKKVDGYQKLPSTEFYSQFDIGVPMAKYEKIPDEEIYLRKYSDGYVYVNPTNKKITNIRLVSGFLPSVDSNNIRKVGASWYLDLNPHDAAIIRPAREVALPISKPARGVALPMSPSFHLQ